jgi:hypothetical protein
LILDLEFSTSRTLSMQAWKEVDAEEVRRLLAGRIHPHVLEVATESHARFWRLDDKILFDDPEEEAPIAFEDLRYNSDLGLHSIDEHQDLD